MARKVEGKCGSCSQVMLVLFNVIFLILGIAMIGIGAWLKVTTASALDGSGSGVSPITGSGSMDMSMCSTTAIQDGTFNFNVCIREICTNLDPSGELCQKLEGLPIGIIVLGAFISLLSFLACCGACTKNTAVLIIYFIVMLIIFVAQIAVVVMFFVAPTWLDTGLSSAFAELGQTEIGSEQLVGLMNMFECCGYPTTSDLTLTLNGVVYTSCSSVPNAILPASVKTNGCKTALMNTIQGNIPVAAGVGAGMVVMQLFALILTCCLIRSFKSGDSGHDEYAGAKNRQTNFQSI